MCIVIHLAQIHFTVTTEDSLLKIVFVTVISSTEAKILFIGCLHDNRVMYIIVVISLTNNFIIKN